jgi:hypothetical protein
MANEPQPLLIIYVTPTGVVKVKIPFRNLSEERAGRELEARCSPIIALLSRAARGVSVPTPNSPIELPEAPVTHATSQTHHPRS